MEDEDDDDIYSQGSNQALFSDEEEVPPPVPTDDGYDPLGSQSKTPGVIYPTSVHGTSYTPRMMTPNPA